VQPPATPSKVDRSGSRTHPADRALYEGIKRELAQRSWRHVQDYAEAKTAVVHEILARADAGRREG
jgi:GrpB-like predicted nucleotidyltransferase (UPF0157 family)